MKLTVRPIALAVSALGLFGLLGLAACGDDDDDSATDTTESTDDAADTTTTEAADATTTTEAAAPADGATVATAESDLGTILVDGEGRTLYLFMPDAQSASTCTDSCLDTWPALAGPATAGSGVDQALLATANRPDDGSAQVTYNGWPLYYFASDAAAGDTNGQGVGNVWYVVDPSGNAISG